MQGAKKRPGAQNQKQRVADRFNAEMPIEVSGVPGVTRNISATGVYFEAGAAQEPGTVVNVTIEVTMGGEKLQFVCEGEIVRVDRDKRTGKVGVAAKLKNSFFANTEEFTDTSALETVPASLDH